MSKEFFIASLFTGLGLFLAGFLGSIWEDFNVTEEEKALKPSLIRNDLLHFLVIIGLVMSAYLLLEFVIFR